MLFSGETEMCNLLHICSPGNLPGSHQVGTQVRNRELGDHERKSRFKAELFD
ncbi:MAG: hypothetical protein NTV68_11515 [Methanomicrobiales archaeon]|nr:hypothetical protein [Methanomicrobiales archaeon]